MNIFAFITFIGLPCFLLVYHLLTKKYLNPYQLIFVFAKKGQGKSTYLTKVALQHLRRGWTVYSTEPIPGCFKIEPKDIGYFEFKPHSLVVVDEAGLIWDNRDFRNFKPEVRDFFVLQRHRHLRVIMCSQSFNVDAKVRSLADSMYLLEKKFRVFSYGKRILKMLDIVEADGSQNSESRIVDQLKFDTPLLFWAGSRTLTFIPAWTKYFDSFTAPPLREKDFPLIPSLEKNRKFPLKHRSTLDD